MDTKLSTWLTVELEKRGWPHRELARRAGVSGQMVSAVIAGTRTPGIDFCVKISKPLGEKSIPVCLHKL